MGNSNRKSEDHLRSIADAADNAMLDLARALDMQKGLIDYLVNLHGHLDQNEFKKVYHYTTYLQRSIQDDVMTKRHIAMSNICKILQINPKKYKKKQNIIKWKIDAYLEEERSVINANSGNFSGFLEKVEGINTKTKSNPTRNERPTPSESTPLLCKSDVQGNRDIRGIEDKTIVVEHQGQEAPEPCCTSTVHDSQSVGTETKYIGEELSRKIDELEYDNDMLRQRLTHVQQTVDLTKQSLKEKSENCLVFQKEIMALKEEKMTTDCTVRSLKETLENRDAQLREEMQKNERHVMTIGTLNNDLKGKEEQLLKVTFSLNQIQQEKINAEEQAKELQLTIIKVNEEAGAKLEHANYKQEQIEIKIKDMHMGMEEKERHLQELRASVEALNEDKIKNEAIILDQKQRIHTLEEKCKSLMEHNDELAKRLIQQNIVRVQVYSPSKSATMMIVEDEMMMLIQTKLENRASEFELVKCIDISDVKQGLPTIIVCVNTSRLGTDVCTILQKFQTNSKMALIVLHHKDAHALPNESSSRVLIGPAFKTLGGVFDMAFLSEKGLYSCKMNEDNFSKLIQFILNLL